MMKKKFLIPLLYDGSPVSDRGLRQQRADGAVFYQHWKGDAFLIRVPGGGYYMCDTKKRGLCSHGPFLEMKKVEHLAEFFLSHGHKDHAGGLKLILKKYPTE